MQKRSNAKVLLWVSILVPLTLLSCAGFPKPTKEKTSLLVFCFERKDTRTNPNPSTTWVDSLSLSGPEAVTVSPRFVGQRVVAVPVVPGTYQMMGRTVQTSWNSGGRSDGGSYPYGAKLVVPEDSVVLVPYRFQITLSGSSSMRSYYYALSDDEIAAVSDELSDTIGFSEWIGKLNLGFGSHPPRTALRKDDYRLRFVSDPAGAEVIVDSEKRGESPTAVDLKPGKHLVEIRKEGFSTWRSYIEVQADTEITTSLKTVEEIRKEGGEATEVARNQYGLLVSPFRNIGSSDSDQLRNVFHESLSATLAQDARLSIFKTPENAPADDKRESTFKPDFDPAQKLGADLLVSGDYYADKEDLLIHASLYDVQKESVKADILYSSKTGFSIFDSIDEMTQKFGAAVDNVLPEAGKQILERKEVTETAIASLERKVTMKDVIERRSRKLNDFFFDIGYGGTVDQVAVEYNGTTEQRSRMPMFSSIGVGYGLHASSSLAFLFRLGIDGAAAQDWVSGTLDWVAYAGPELTLSGSALDLYIRVLAQGRFSGPTTYYEWDNTAGDYVSIAETGTFTFLGLTLEPGVRFYTYTRYSQPAGYVDFGMRYTPFLYRWGSDALNAEPVSIPLQAAFYVGLGVRL